jgi:hypothetical protein
LDSTKNFFTIFAIFCNPTVFAKKFSLIKNK